MSSLNNILLALATLPEAVLGHGHVRDARVNGKVYPGYERWSKNQDLNNVVTWKFTTGDEGPVSISDINGPNIICHNGATNAKASIPVNAGDEIVLRRYNEIGGFEHPGPELHYLAPCGNAGCASVDKTTLKFYKIYEEGLVKGGMADAPDWNTQKWATTEAHKKVYPEDQGFIDEFTVRIPEDTPTGPYILRHELFGLHMADKGDAEFYPQCVNLEISGKEGGNVPKGVSATEFYQRNDPGIAIDIWKNLKSYQIPGPSVAASPSSKRHSRDVKPSH
ncbi:lytic polysaccharide monooxygenase [Whalleya microplaca]|nr:lytic polysaccharide monooxygenase [Whalleya microplaca]